MNAIAFEFSRSDARGRWVIPVAGLMIGLATALGAFGSHALKQVLPSDRLQVYDLAVTYQFYHSLGLLGIGFAVRFVDSALLRFSAWMVLAGMLLFAGSIYAVAFGAPRALNFVTPFGGASLMIGWASFALAMWRARTSTD
jgi:uncharacterized membrane protein YgdD (TMEM256/DUF423 family)